MSEEQQKVVIPGPGVILRKAREGANLSTDEIAKKLHLKNSLVVDLENDNYDINISLTFIKGYLKLYAKQVNVPENIVVDAFEGMNTQPKEPAKLQSFSRRFSHQANDDKLMLVTYLIIAVVIALAVVWWFQQSDGDSFLSSSSSSSTVTAPQIEETAEQSESEVSELQAVPVSTPATVTIEPQADITENEPLEIEEQAQPEQAAVSQLIEDTQAIAEQGIAELDDIKQNLETSTATSADTSAAQANEVASDVVGATENQTNAEPVELVFEFADNCWMNLADATGENIAYGVKVKGRVMPVTGIPPFVITLGAPEVVQISYAGEPVDMSFITPGRSAKFTLPLAE